MKSLWNAHCRKTAYAKDREGRWTLYEDMASLTEWKSVDPHRTEHTVTVLVSMEWYVDGEAYCASTAFRTEEIDCIGIFCKECNLVGQH